MRKWIIDFSGTKTEVIKALRATTITEGMTKEAQALLTESDHGEFERAQRYLLAEIEHCTSSHIGVSAYQMPNSIEADAGDTLSIHIAEYTPRPV